MQNSAFFLKPPKKRDFFTIANVKNNKNLYLNPNICQKNYCFW